MSVEGGSPLQVDDTMNRPCMYHGHEVPRSILAPVNATNKESIGVKRATRSSIWLGFGKELVADDNVQNFRIW